MILQNQYAPAPVTCSYACMNPKLSGPCHLCWPIASALLVALKVHWAGLVIGFLGKQQGTCQQCRDLGTSVRTWQRDRPAFCLLPAPACMPGYAPVWLEPSMHACFARVQVVPACNHTMYRKQLMLVSGSKSADAKAHPLLMCHCW